MGKLILKRTVKRLTASIFPEATRLSVVLTYHSVGSGRVFSQPAERFNEQMRMLAHRFHVVPLATLVERVERGAERLAAVTFDDGFEDVYTRAFPILRSLSLPFTVFVSTGFVESGPGFFDWSPHYAGLPPLTWKQIREMMGAGCNIGAHTHSHPRLSTCTVEEITQELVKSKEIIEHRTSTEVKALAYPFGQRHDYDARVIAIAKQAGYKIGCTTLQKCLLSIGDRYQIPRIVIDANDEANDFVQKITGQRDFVRWIEYCNSALVRNGLRRSGVAGSPSAAGPCP